ncbi:hypothetical protein PHMEG_00025315 [Phytophthora megakarya]|uniref:Uncharacterized protein n=1 Tax=Phytophthora megakarya TaxID=4795 RepID=A0A225VCB6_9STRA|nr:hypothetical protein PHMEG_00025315 [Phytophthora megakarya]
MYIDGSANELDRQLAISKFPSSYPREKSAEQWFPTLQTKRGAPKDAASTKPAATKKARVSSTSKGAVAAKSPTTKKASDTSLEEVRAPGEGESSPAAEQNEVLIKQEKGAQVSVVANPHIESDPVKPAQPTYLSPVERYQKMRQEQDLMREVVTSVKGLHDYIKANDISQPSVRAQLEAKGNVVWTSSHIVKTGELARIHIADLDAPEPLEEMRKCFRDAYQNDGFTIDQLLITVAVFGCTAATPGIPPDGAIVNITNPSKVNLFMGQACQLNVRLANLSFDA